jgi:iron complex transport system substrate-binding protein
MTIRRGSSGRLVLWLASWPLAALVLACLTLACSAPPAGPPAAKAGADGFPRTVTDGAGRSLLLRARPARIVSQALASDEMLFPMVAAERLVGLSALSRDPKYSNVVTEATPHPAPSIESAEDIVRLRPDLIFVTTYSRAETVQVLEASGAPVYRLANFDDVAGVTTNLRRIGAAVGEEAAAERMVAEMQRRLAAVAARRAGRPPLRVLSFSGGFTAGRGTSFDDIVRHAGAINEAAARGIDKFPRISEEQVLAWNPDVLVAGALPGEADAVRRRLLEGPGTGQTTAGRTQQIVILETRRLLAVSQHVVEAVEQLADSLDAFQNRAR